MGNVVLCAIDNSGIAHKLGFPPLSQITG